MHVSVLLEELVNLVMTTSDGVYVDATGGRGGHADLLLKKLSPQSMLLILDWDQKAVNNLAKRFEKDSRTRVRLAAFSDLSRILKEENISGIDGLVADLGISSDQLEDTEKGISFKISAPLDMRMNALALETAADIVNNKTEEELALIFYKLGEERHSKKVARAIVCQREERPFFTTDDLRILVGQVLGRFYRKQRIHPATRIFQALRLAVNQELEELEVLLESIPGLLKPGRRAGIIAFHSLEDRLVKHAFKRLVPHGWKLITKKPVRPSEQEIQQNPRSRSAKLRVIEKMEASCRES